MTASFWIIMTGILASASCGMLGSFLVLRRMSMLGDAISHAVLPGIALAFLISNSRHPIPMLLGAAACGLLTAFVTELLHRTGRLQQDASIGVTFTWLFALGVILISAFAGQVDLDQECVLYGEITFVPLEPHVFIWGLDLGPQPFVIMSAVCLLSLALIILFYKELLITSFDTALALSLGINVVFIQYLLMGMVSTTIVAAFESVGAILVVAMLIAPGATAYLLTNRLPTMMLLAVLHATLSTLLGVYLAVWIDASVAGAIAVVGLILFLLAFLFSPSQGILFSRKCFRQQTEAPAPVKR